MSDDKGTVLTSTGWSLTEIGVSPRGWNLGIKILLNRFPYADNVHTTPNGSIRQMTTPSAIWYPGLNRKRVSFVVVVPALLREYSFCEARLQQQKKICSQARLLWVRCSPVFLIYSAMNSLKNTWTFQMVKWASSERKHFQCINQEHTSTVDLPRYASHVC